MRRSARVVTLLVGFFLALSTLVVAQTATTSLRGTVYDAKGAVVAGASVMIVNPATEFSRRTKSDNQGGYEFVDLPPATYELIVNSTGTETSRWAYRAVFCAQYGVALISTIAWPFMPESAYWLMSKNRRSDALKSLRRLGMAEIQAERHTDNIQHTLDQISQETAGASFLECFRRSNLRRTIVSIAPLSIQALCGVTFVINYTAYYLQLAGFSAHKSFQIQIAQDQLAAGRLGT